MPKFYAVVNGRSKGIYTNWPDCQRSVTGYPGAIYKSFSTLEDAKAFLNPCKASTPKILISDDIIPCTSGNNSKVSFDDFTKSQEKESNLPAKTVIYTDGSYKDGKGGYGAVVIEPNGNIREFSGSVPIEDVTSNKAELYCILSVLNEFKGDLIILSDSEYSVKSLSIWVHNWIKNDWKGVANRFLIEPCYNLMKGRKVELIHVKGHSGNKYNERADQLAEFGRNSIKPKEHLFQE